MYGQITYEWPNRAIHSRLLLLLLKHYLLKLIKEQIKNIFAIAILKCTFIGISISMKDVFQPHDIFLYSFSLCFFSSDIS